MPLWRGKEHCHTAISMARGCFSPPVCMSCPHPNTCTVCKDRERFPLLQAVQQDGQHNRAWQGSCLRAALMLLAKSTACPVPMPYVLHCRAGQEQCLGDLQLQAPSCAPSAPLCPPVLCCYSTSSTGHILTASHRHQPWPHPACRARCPRCTTKQGEPGQEKLPMAEVCSISVSPACQRQRML